MHSLSQLSRRYLKRQWKRTIFTSLGIVMATALFAGLALLFTSFINMYTEAEAARSGSWHYHVSGLSMEQANQLQANIRIKDSELIANSVYMAKLGDSESDDEWLILRDISEIGDSLNPYPMTVFSGRLPENDSEIVLNTALFKFFPGLELDQEIELDLFDLREGNTSGSQKRTYKVVGIADWTDTQLPAPVYYALTHIEESEKKMAEVYLTVKASTDFESNILAALEDVLPELSETFPNIKYPTFNNESVWEDIQTVRLQTHDGLLRYLGQSSYDGTNASLLTFFGILAAIIMISVIFVIRNSFAMSVSERSSEYGLLRVVGGSPSQIRRLVLQDAVQMAIIGIPVGLFSGVIAMKITLDYVSNLGLPEVEYLKLIVSPWPLVIAALLSLLAIVLAAISPAVKAGKLSPMEAVRKTGVYSVEKKSSKGLMRKGKINRKLVGVTGFLAGRSIRRDRKRFRITTLSVMISAILFLSAGGISYLFSKQLTYFNTEQIDFRLYTYSQNESDSQTTQAGTGNYAAGNADLNMLYSILDREKMIERIALYGQFSQPMQSDPDIFSEELIEVIQKSHFIGGQPFSREQALETLSGNSYVRILLADREFLDQININNPDQVWQQMQQGQVIISQTNPVNISDLSFQTISLTNLSPGDSINMANVSIYDDEKEEEIEMPGLPESYKIAAEIDQLPWFIEGFFSGNNSIMLIADREFMMQEYFAKTPALSQALSIEEILAIDAAAGYEADVYKLLEPYVDQNVPGMQSSLYIQNNYESMVTARGIVKMLNVFVYGFATVIVLICSMNILNTVTTNVLLRRRELAMLQAVGMSRSQVRKMLLMECSLYGANGAIWGSIIGTGLLYLLGQSIEGTMGSLTLQALPWNMIIATFAGAIIISILAGILPIRRVMKDQIVEAIRAQE